MLGENNEPLDGFILGDFIKTCGGGAAEFIGEGATRLLRPGETAGDLRRPTSRRRYGQSTVPVSRADKCQLYFFGSHFPLAELVAGASAVGSGHATLAAVIFYNLQTRAYH
jgi:hypothetical protein